MTTSTCTPADIDRVEPVIGMEIHVELATRTKMFTRAPSPAHPAYDGAAPNTLIDPVVLALPGALPVMNRAAVEMSVMVGLALGCSIAPVSRWDRKSYFYPDLPKAYQISQYDLPLCFDGEVVLPATDEQGRPDFDREGRRIGILRAHLEEDAGKLLHEAPGGGPIEGSIVDLNRAGTPLLEIVTQPDFRTSAECVAFSRILRNTCRFLGASEGIMQKGHMRFEPNINCRIHLRDGRVIPTPIVEVKNLNSFRALADAIDYELAAQPGRWLEDGREMGPGAKSTRGWDPDRGITVLQREKEDAHDYRYFPDPDLPQVRVDHAWLESIRKAIPELPLERAKRYVGGLELSSIEAGALTEEREVCLLFDHVVDTLASEGLGRITVARHAANLILQSGQKRANERGVIVTDLGFSQEQVVGIVRLREEGAVSAGAMDELLGLCALDASADPRELAASQGLMVVRDEGRLEAWCDEVIAEQPAIAEQVRGGKLPAAGRLIGAVMQRSGGSADAKAVREMLLRKLGQG
ncbi:MAG: Asp-tRNA(Asn)/Glu-tRNA(Gln) amidotransferase subunit GatB [Phycisphaerales bacterium]|nr:Asp-tRNA(Asn)/Glu-tRNA(Gln) amidotransferase subunit GatB [Phycisphaerales bacterium]